MNTFQKLSQARDLIDQTLENRAGSFRPDYLPAESLAQKQKLLNGDQINTDVFDVVNAITSLAMANTDVIHVFVDFSGHLNSIRITVRPASTNYNCQYHLELLSEQVFLRCQNALEQLLYVESLVTELVIEAREAAEISAGGQA